MRLRALSLALVVVVACTATDPKPGAASTASETTSTSTTARPGPSSSAPDAATSLAIDACASPYRAQQMSFDLRAAMIHESVDDEHARFGTALNDAATKAGQAAAIDDHFADAEGYWAANSLSTSSASDPRLDAALKTVSSVCGDVGVPDGRAFLRVPVETLAADTPDRGRFNACADMVFGHDGSVFANGRRFTFDDCDRVTQGALSERDRHDAYVDAVDLFLAETGGFVCVGSDCRTNDNFSPR